MCRYHIFFFARFASFHGKSGAFSIAKLSFTGTRKILFLFSVPLGMPTTVSKKMAHFWAVGIVVGKTTHRVACTY